MVNKLSFFVGCSIAAWIYFRVLPEMRAHRSVKNDMEPDQTGNYDLDGVSYDPSSHNVVAAGDGTIAEPVAEIAIVEEVVSLHAPEKEKPRDVVA